MASPAMHTRIKRQKHNETNTWAIPYKVEQTKIPHLAAIADNSEI
jgi:hypothetical protein